jgi:hypothetical protein
LPRQSGGSPSRGRVGGGAPLWRSSPAARLRCGARVSVALRTRFVHCAHFTQTAAASQIWKRAGTHADRNPALLAAPESRHRPPAHGFAKKHRRFFGGGRTRAGHRARLAPQERACGARQAAGSMPAACPLLSHKRNGSCKAWGRPLWGCVCGGEERSPGVGARTRALPQLTRRVCLNATSAASAVSYAARPQAEYRSEPAQPASQPQPHSGRPQALPARFAHALPPPQFQRQTQIASSEFSAPDCARSVKRRAAR